MLPTDAPTCTHTPHTPTAVETAHVWGRACALLRVAALLHSLQKNVQKNVQCPKLLLMPPWRQKARGSRPLLPAMEVMLPQPSAACVGIGVRGWLRSRHPSVSRTRCAPAQSVSIVHRQALEI